MRLLRNFLPSFSTADVKSSSATSASTRTGKRGSSNLVALGSATVLAVYAAGFMRTQVAASRFADESAVRRSAPNARVSVATSTTVAPAKPVEVSAGFTPTVAKAAPVTKSSTRKDIKGAVDSVTQSAKSAKSASSAMAVVSTPATAPPPPIASAPATVAAQLPPAVQAPAPAPSPAPLSAAAAPIPLGPPYRDGMFFGRGTSRHGDIEAMVEIKDGRIISASISQCLTRYSCSWIAALPPQVVARQSPDVDYVSGATQSANAFYYAVAEALSRSK